MLNDISRSELKIRSVQIVCLFNHSESYIAGQEGVTSIEWGKMEGSTGWLRTVVIYRYEKVYSEHAFSNVVGVYYA